MDKNEAIIRYAMQHGKLDDLKVWLLNGGSVNEYFTSHKQNIKLVIKEKSFSVTAKEAADIVEGMMPIEFSRQDFVNLYFKLSEEKQEELYDEVFSYYPQVIRTKKNPSSKEILDAVKRAHYIYFPDNFYDILSMTEYIYRKNAKVLYTGKIFVKQMVIITVSCWKNTKIFCQKN